ncbi:glycosyltransferase family 2 protein [Pandoraea norimbergensis]|uniref:glycosyltransferase family 2 protein n=1 Tax=Pandoraea norimbergensis TaxID=93219 RepID=UPI0009FBA3D2|nr:glycosyltransferase family 2 protein [Pandoraea norimbergensis]
MTTTLSLIVPTRERAAYLPHAVRTCLAGGGADLDVEILILDNASTDGTQEVVAGMKDSRIRYVRNDVRLSMRDNFEKGLNLASGDVLCFIGDDDGILPGAAARAMELFAREDIDAISAARAHYFWPDLVSARKNTGLLPRHDGVEIFDARQKLNELLDHGDYYRLPCLYHGFVRRSVVERVKQRQGRFFLSCQVDMFSSIALSMEGIRYAFSRSPLIINGGSSRSNGASHFGGGTDKEKNLWKQEDDLGFLPGFDGCIGVPALIVESALRYCQGNPANNIAAMLGESRVRATLQREAAAREAAGRAAQEIEQMYSTAGITRSEAAAVQQSSGRAARLMRSFLDTRPVNMGERGVHDVYGASQQFGAMIAGGHTGVAYNPMEQIFVAMRLAKG